MKNPSASEMIYTVLIDHPIGYQFSLDTLHKLVNNRYGVVTEGAVAGFTNRAIKAGLIKRHHRFKPAKGKGSVIYELISKTAWAFKAAGVGSNAGRTINKSPHVKLETIKEDVPLAEPEEKNVIVDTDNEKVQFSVDEGSLADQLVAIAVQVAALEARQEKTIQDFTINELIDEIKRRVDEGERYKK